MVGLVLFTLCVRVGMVLLRGLLILCVRILAVRLGAMGV